jgi:hypothetical protein
MNTDSEDHSQRGLSDEDDLGSLIPVIQDKLVEAFAGKLNLSLFDIYSQLVEGKKLWQIAYDQGFTLQESERFLIEARKEALNEAVRQGEMQLYQVQPVEFHMHRRLEMELENA